jgi:hypothetical protein
VISLAEVALDPDFAQSFVVTRQTGTFQRGGFVGDAPVEIPFYGIIQPATDEDLRQVPEGDRVSGSQLVISTAKLYRTFTDGIGTTSGFSDTFVWGGKVYKVLSDGTWSDFGYWEAIAVRAAGA